MKHHHLVLVSALASALAACGGGGQDNTASSSGATSNAAANTNVTVNASSAASHQAVADAERNAAAAQQRAMELQVRAATQRAELEEARRRAAEAEAVANAQQSEIAQQQAIEIKKKLTELQDKYDAVLQEIADVQAEIITIEQTPPSPTPIEVEQVTIPSCDQNAVPVRDPETNLLLVCESQIITGNQTADVGTQKHASGRYYVLPFPDHSMMVVGKKAAYKYACGQHFCEWLKVGGSLDIEYGAASKDDKFYRFTSCRTGLESKRICAVPLSEFPDGVPSSFDGREPEPVKVGAKIDSSDVSGVARFRAGAPTKSPAACATLKNDALVLPWPQADMFEQRDDGAWYALFDGGNCMGDVRVEASDLESPQWVTYTASAAGALPYEVLGPAGTKMRMTALCGYSPGLPCRHEFAPD